MYVMIKYVTIYYLIVLIRKKLSWFESHNNDEREALLAQITGTRLLVN